MTVKHEMDKRKRPNAFFKELGEWLNDTEQCLTEEKVVILDEIRWVRRIRSKIAKGTWKEINEAVTVSMFAPMLDMMRRIAAQQLNEAVSGGVPKTEKARKSMARDIRFWFGILEHEIRDIVRYLYPIRRNDVADYVRDGKVIKGYTRIYGDPSHWNIPEALFSENARIFYPYILKAPLPKRSNWYQQRQY